MWGQTTTVTYIKTVIHHTEYNNGNNRVLNTKYLLNIQTSKKFNHCHIKMTATKSETTEILTKFL